MVFSRSVGWVFFILLVLIFLTYRSFEPRIFYISWLSGFVILVLALAFFILLTKLPKSILLSLVILGAWVVWALIITPFATDIGHHLKILVVSVFYIIVSSFLSFFLLRSRIRLSVLMYYLVLAWVVINGFLFILYLSGYYVPDKNDFSGVFHDRNVFSITSLIVIALTLSFVNDRKKRFSMSILIIFCILMILVSKSVTGFLGLIVLLIFFGYSLSASKKFLVFLFAFILLIGVLATSNPLADRIDRFIMSATGQTELLNDNESAYIRAYLIVSGFSLAADKSFTGVGLDNARLHILWPGRDTGTFLHNNYLDILTSGGIPLFILYYMPIFLALLWLVFNKIAACKIDKRMWNAAFLVLLLKLVYDLTWTTYFEFAMVFSVVLAINIIIFFRQRMKVGNSTLYRQHT